MEKKKRPRCHNCKFAGESFKITGKTHMHCEHPKYTDEDFQSGKISAWDTLCEFWNTCPDHEFTFIADMKGKTRDDIAVEYAKYITWQKPQLFFEKINQIILTKYKDSGLLYIKEKAWKIVNARIIEDEQAADEFLVPQFFDDELPF